MVFHTLRDSTNALQNVDRLINRDPSCGRTLESVT
jgi:hypothetical protein